MRARGGTENGPRSVRCWTSRHRWRSSSTTTTRSTRSRRPTSSPAICCSSAPDRRSPSTASSMPGEGDVDESMVTGESLPVHKEPGAEAIGATINTNGTLRVRATKVGSETALAQIVKLVQNAPRLQGPGTAAHGPRRLLARPRGARRRRAHVPRLAGPRRRRRIHCAALRHHRGRDHLPRRTGAGLCRRPSWSARGWGKARHPLQECRGHRADRSRGPVVFDKTGTLTEGKPQVVEVVAAGNRLDTGRIAAPSRFC